MNVIVSAMAVMFFVVVHQIDWRYEMTIILTSLQSFDNRTT